MDENRGAAFSLVFDIQRLRRRESLRCKVRIVLQQGEHIRAVPRGDALWRVAAADAVGTNRFADNQRLPRIQFLLCVQPVVKKNAAFGNAVLLGNRANALAERN